MNTIKIAILAKKNAIQATRKYLEAAQVVEEKRPDLHARLSKLVDKRYNINWFFYTQNESSIKASADILKRP